MRKIRLLLSATLLMVGSSVFAYTPQQINQAIDTVMMRHGRESRGVLLKKIHNKIQESDRLDDAQRTVFVEVLEQKLEAYTDSTNDRLLRKGLITDTSTIRIPFDEILDGGPGKDGIPALTDPVFVSQSEAREREYVWDDLEGMVVVNKDKTDARFYPFSILNRHEIVNDTIDGEPIMVTFCPLCGTAIAYSREIDGRTLEFGVSGLLYQSNLLMYDKETETLWGQAFGEGLVGTYTDYPLRYRSSRQMTYAQFRHIHPQGVVMSDETGYLRDYRLGSPYAGYTQNDELYFPVNEFSDELPAKTLMVVVNDFQRGYSAAFHRADLLEAGIASLPVDEHGSVIAIAGEDGVIGVEDGHFILPHFNEMRFSWSARNPGSNLFWYAGKGGVDSE